MKDFLDNKIFLAILNAMMMTLLKIRILLNACTKKKIKVIKKDNDKKPKSKT